MRRVFWLAVGAGVGVFVVRRLGQAAGRLTIPGLAERAGTFWAQVRAAAAEREEELRAALGLDGGHDETDVRPGGPATDNR